MNTRFKKRSGKKWTHLHPNGSCLLTKWINSYHNCEVAIHSVVFKPIIGHNLQIST